jgi:hypothetical protein
MKVKLKPCDGCGKPSVIWKNHKGQRYCKECWKLELPKLEGGKHKPTLLQKPLPSRSPKRKKEEAQYLKLRLDFLNKHPMCQAHLQGCKTYATEVHHKAGRTGDLFLDPKYWLSTCRPCHAWIENHPEEAKELGFSITRSNEQKTTGDE